MSLVERVLWMLAGMLMFALAIIMITPALAQDTQCPAHDAVARLLRKHFDERLLWQGNVTGDENTFDGNEYRTLELWVGPNFRSWTLLEIVNETACMRFVGSKWSAFPLALDRRE